MSFVLLKIEYYFILVLFLSPHPSSLLGTNDTRSFKIGFHGRNVHIHLVCTFVGGEKHICSFLPFYKSLLKREGKFKLQSCSYNMKLSLFVFSREKFSFQKFSSHFLVRSRTIQKKIRGLEVVGVPSSPRSKVAL